jgi:hypothetical protein
MIMYSRADPQIAPPFLLHPLTPIATLSFQILRVISRLKVSCRNISHRTWTDCLCVQSFRGWLGSKRGRSPARSRRESVQDERSPNVVAKSQGLDYAAAASRRPPTHCATCGRTTPVIAISDNVTTPPVFKSETEELHHLHMELQLLKDQVQDVARVCNVVARGRRSPSQCRASLWCNSH